MVILYNPLYPTNKNENKQPVNACLYNIIKTKQTEFIYSDGQPNDCIHI